MYSEWYQGGTELLSLLIIGIAMFQHSTGCPTHLEPVTYDNGSFKYCNPDQKRYGVSSLYVYDSFFFHACCKGKLPTCLSTETCEYRWMGMYTCCTKNLKRSGKRRPPPFKPLIRTLNGSQDDNKVHTNLDAGKLSVKGQKLQRDAPFSDPDFFDKQNDVNGKNQVRRAQIGGRYGSIGSILGSIGGIQPGGYGNLQPSGYSSNIQPIQRIGDNNLVTAFPPPAPPPIGGGYGQPPPGPFPGPPPRPILRPGPFPPPPRPPRPPRPPPPPPRPPTIFTLPPPRPTFPFTDPPVPVYLTAPPFQTPRPFTSFTPRPFTQRPFTPRPFTQRPFTPRPFTPRPFTRRPFTPRPFTRRPFTPRPFTSRPFTPRPFTPRPFTPRPFTPRPFTSRPFTPRPFTQRPFTDFRPPIVPGYGNTLPPFQPPRTPYPVTPHFYRTSPFPPFQPPNQPPAPFPFTPRPFFPPTPPPSSGYGAPPLFVPRPKFRLPPPPRVPWIPMRGLPRELQIVTISCILRPDRDSGISMPIPQNPNDGFTFSGPSGGSFSGPSSFFPPGGSIGSLAFYENRLPLCPDGVGLVRSSKKAKKQDKLASNKKSSKFDSSTSAELFPKKSQNFSKWNDVLAKEK